MLKQYPPFVASLHVTVRIEPLSRAIDEDAAFEKLTSGLECGALEAVRGTCWKGYSITIDKGPPAPALASDPAPNVFSAQFATVRAAIQDELIRQHRQESSSLKLVNLIDDPDHARTCDAVTVAGRFDIAALAKAICSAFPF